MNAILPAALAAILLAACSEPVETRVDDVRPVRVVRIGAVAGGGSVEYAAEVRARREVRLSFRVGGKIVERLVEVGSTLRAGQPVARLDPSDLALAVASAQAQVASAETDRRLAAADLKRYRELRERNFISQAEYDRRASALEAAEARRRAAEAQYRQAANQAAYAVLKADGDGIVTAIEAEAGQVVAAGQTVVRLARRGEIEAEFAVPEAQRERAERAAEMEVTLAALPGRSWKARLRELSPAADPVTRTYAARATILDPGAQVELGMSARVTLRDPAPAPRIEIPVAAIHSRTDGAEVFIVGADGTVAARPVTTAGIAGERIVISDGLRPGDVVVAAGASLLRPGQRVRVMDGKK